MPFILKDTLYVFLISMLPLIELRGAIPIGAALGVHFVPNALMAIIGNLLPIPFILIFIPKILDFMARFKIFKPIVAWLRKKADKHSKKVIGDAGEDEEIEAKTVTLKKGEGKKARLMTRGIFVALCLFVAIPLPGTGAWTGALVAALFSLPKRSSFLAIALGVLICAAIMALASYGVLGFLSFLL